MEEVKKEDNNKETPPLTVEELEKEINKHSSSDYDTYEKFKKRMNELESEEEKNKGEK